MYSEEVSGRLSNYLQNRDHDAFISLVSEYLEDPKVGSLMNDISDEWRKLLIARKNGLMDEEQVHFAMVAFFRKKKTEITAALEE